MRFIWWLSEPHRRTVGRGPVPRRAWVVKETVRSLWDLDSFRFGRAFAGDRPPRYGEEIGNRAVAP